MAVRKTGAFIVGVAFVGTAFVVVGVATPFISLVAAPIFAIKAAPEWWEHRKLYHRTLTNLTRAKFGRIEGQDYTRWDGKEVKKNDTKPTWQEKVHELMNLYPHGGPECHGPKFSSYERKIPEEAPADYPFKTKEDQDWLEIEFSRREQKDLLDSDLRMLCAFAKALIPFIGLLWVLATETNVGGASQMVCGVCAAGADSEESHWGWKEAIRFHQEIIRTRVLAHKII